MDNSVLPDALDLDTEEISDKVTCKRRSLVFHSRTSKLFIDEELNEVRNLENDDLLSDNKCKRQRVKDITGKESFNLQEYINDLKQERKLWQLKLKERKSKRRILTKQKSALENLGQNLDYKALSDSERSFLLAKPNYDYIYENSQKLSNRSLKVILLNELMFKLNDKFIIRMQEKLDKITKKIIEISKF
ncbi:PREDICTED: uncharacterized protein LOC106785573 [Polistes canadensis]|uniref:uncharacterized protein LOC106785573 n=1 Tax=Polistes canadensis TaxID=91411 RepID=UPI000718E817|nr:PREDICTED: uncharacterized protein LOC106785573 [Polistes canadensis]